jgi:predicted metal-dependent hydrolase
MAMPRWAYNPGTDGAPDRDPLEIAKQLVPRRFEPFVPANDHAFQYGLALHDAGFFWEAHEIWEAVWKAAPMNGRDRLALRALIQIANAGLKLRQARSRAASRSIEEARCLLGELIARGASAARESVAERLRAAALMEDLGNRAPTDPLVLLRFFSREKMQENA